MPTVLVKKAGGTPGPIPKRAIQGGGIASGKQAGDPVGIEAAWAGQGDGGVVPSTIRKRSFMPGEYALG